MVSLTDAQKKTIKKFASHPSGLGYVLDFSNQTFSNWFRDNWRYNIDDPQFEEHELSKGNRLVAFCQREQPKLVLSVLQSLWDLSHEMDVGNSNQVSHQDIAAFASLLAYLSNDNTDTDATSIGGVTKVSLIANANTNKESLLLFTAATLEQLSTFEEVIRSNNALAIEQPERRAKLLDLLSALIKHLELLLDILPPENILPTDPAAEKIVGWTERYMNGALPKLQEYFEPEALGRTTVPAGVILLCGGLGSLFTGFNPIGFGVGSYAGKLIIGEMKSGVAIDKIGDAFDNPKE